MAVKFLRIAQMIAGNKIVDPDAGTPTTGYLRMFNDMISNIQSRVNDIKEIADTIVRTLELVGITLVTAEEARDLALAQISNQNLINSFVSPSNVMSASADGTTAKIIIVNHTRQYGDGSTVSVLGSTITGLPYATELYIVYDDILRAGGAVTYLATPDATVAGQGLDRHLVGGVTTPADSTVVGPVPGGGTRPPGIPNWKFPVVDDVTIE